MTRLRRPGVLAFVPDPWDAVWMPRHQVLSRLSRYFPVVWMDPPLEWRVAWTRVPMRRGRAGLDGYPDFAVYRPGRFLPRMYRPRLAVELTEQGRLLRAQRALRSLNAEPAILYLWRPEFARLLDSAPHRVSCYHVDDEYSFSVNEQPVGSEETGLLRRVDQVIIHSPALWEKRSSLASRAALVPNGVDYDAFATPASEPDDLGSVPRPRLGYVGVVKRQLDVPLLLELATRRPDWSFVFVGPVRSLGEDETPFTSLRALRNVYVLGERPVRELPAYVQHMDVGLMPYDVNDYTRYIYPLKLHEYLAAGLPIVATPIRTLQDFREVVALAQGIDEWLAALEDALSPASRNPFRVTERRDTARPHDWNRLVARIALLLAERLGPPWVQRVAAAAPPDLDPQTPNSR